MLDNFKWTGNMKYGDDGAMVFWRVENMLNVHPLSQMLSTDARRGLTVMVYDSCTRNDKYVGNRTAVKVATKQNIAASPLSFMSDKAIATLADVVVSALYPEKEES